ncbi:MAG: hypothetical protein Q8927_12780 [Bacteroidota bacterium]|nr:hypothetical protein [Bacteroidota bacterium]MDP4217068.1 hypothetical protein [Bacteroidota bacterium]MDP4244412.1 hypothetical protein [Bacteroidota bacterium]MDP4254848.1 hypothetical protein [Bacteroidota bacterium]MDP4259791.1 hypothetical protein [Bacteroidota bacterium]
MKVYSLLVIVAVVSCLAACKKEQPPYENHFTQERIVRYELYTTKDFSDESNNIQFSLTMRKVGKTLFDSTLATMKISEIPDSAHRIIIERRVPRNDTSRLAVGFDYAIENVGNSWYVDEFPAGDTLKVVRFSFK